ncbi:MAG: hemerythrin domain-containing protein [Pseudomonadota bacterium]
MTTMPLLDRRGDWMKPADKLLIADPLAFLVEDHLRHRQICSFLIANARRPQPNFETVALALAFLRHEFLLHDADERASLYPLMHARCEPDDEIELLIQRLMADHDTAREMAKMVCEILEGALEGPESLDNEESAQLLAFADKVKRYITLENAIILPLARTRLTTEDLATISKAMLLRRGVVMSSTERVQPRSNTLVEADIEPNRQRSLEGKVR